MTTIKIPSTKSRLSRLFYNRPADQVAVELLGKILLRCLPESGRWIGGRIVETEAYLSSDDPGSHSSRGLTKSNASMFGRPGTLYVYPIHGKVCMNAVTESEGLGSAVLLRAIEPIWGIEEMQNSRGYEDTRRLTRGPSMLCQALSVNRSEDGIDLTEHPHLMIADAAPRDFQITKSVRIGVNRGAELQLRYFVNGNRFVSGKKSDHV